jgi:hypothetical protein
MTTESWEAQKLAAFWDLEEEPWGRLLLRYSVSHINIFLGFCRLLKPQPQTKLLFHVNVTFQVPMVTPSMSAGSLNIPCCFWWFCVPSLDLSPTLPISLPPFKSQRVPSPEWFFLSSLPFFCHQQSDFSLEIRRSWWGRVTSCLVLPFPSHQPSKELDMTSTKSQLDSLLQKLGFWSDLSKGVTWWKCIVSDGHAPKRLLSGSQTRSCGFCPSLGSVLLTWTSAYQALICHP